MNLLKDINEEDLLLEIRRMPEELILDIMLRLPVKSLGRFKCVSKKWLDLIESSRFINNHLSVNISKSDNCSILIKYFDDVESKTILTNYNHFSDKKCYGLLGISSIRDVRVSDFSTVTKDIVTQSNGIVCITDHRTTFIGLMNPVLNEIQKIIVPIDLIFPSGFPSEFKSLMFGVAFGFDKVVRLVQFYKDTSHNTSSYSYIESQVYDLTKHSWRKSIHKQEVINVSSIYPPFHRPFHNPNISPPNPTVFNGILHSCFLHEWSMTGGINDFFIKPSKLIFNILTFNIALESFLVMEFPHELRDYNYDFGEDYRLIFLPSIFAVDQTTLGLVLFTGPEYKTYSPNDRFGSSMDVWIMKEYGVTDSWIKRYSVTSTHLRFGKPLSLWDNDKIFLLTKDGELNCQNLHNGRCHQLKQFHSVDFSSFQVVICNESLVSVDKYFEHSPMFWRRL